MAPGNQQTSISDTATWSVWVNQTSETSQSTSSIYYDDLATWRIWTTSKIVVYNGSSAYFDNYVWNNWVEKDNRTVAQKEADALVEREAEKLRRKERMLEEIQKKKAEVKAKLLLKEVIGKEKFDEFKSKKNLLFKGKKFSYLLNESGNIQQLGENSHRSMCIHLKERSKYPKSDNLVALILELMDDEERFVKTANLGLLAESPYQLPNHVLIN